MYAVLRCDVMCVCAIVVWILWIWWMCERREALSARARTLLQVPYVPKRVSVREPTMNGSMRETPHNSLVSYLCASVCKNK